MHLPEKSPNQIKGLCLGIIFKEIAGCGDVFKRQAEARLRLRLRDYVEGGRRIFRFCESTRARR